MRIHPIILRAGAIIVLLALLFCDFPSIPDARGDELPEELVAHWMFDEEEGDTVEDSSEMGNDGTLKGPMRVMGECNRWLEFDGVDDYVSIPTEGFRLENSMGLGVFAWINTTSPERGTIFSYGFPAKDRSATMSINQRGPDGCLTVDFYEHNVTYDISVNDGMWHFVGFSLPPFSRKLTMVVDDSFVVKNLTAVPSIGNNRIDRGSIGRWPVSGWGGEEEGKLGLHYFEGYVDEVSVFGNELDEEEIREIYSGYNVTSLFEFHDKVPVALPRMDNEPRLGVPVYFSNKGSYDPDGEIVRGYLWDLGDGEELTGDSPNHTFMTPGDRTVALRVSAGRLVGVGYLNITIPENEPPTAIALGNKSRVIGLPISFNAEESTDPEGLELDYLWELDDGNTSNDGKLVYYYFEPGVYIVRLTVTDPFGGSDSTNHTLTVFDPTAVGGGDAPVPDSKNSLGFRYLFNFILLGLILLVIVVEMLFLWARKGKKGNAADILASTKAGIPGHGVIGTGDEVLYYQNRLNARALILLVLALPMMTMLIFSILGNDPGVVFMVMMFIYFPVLPTVPLWWNRKISVYRGRMEVEYGVGGIRKKIYRAALIRSYDVSKKSIWERYGYNQGAVLFYYPWQFKIGPGFGISNPKRAYTVRLQIQCPDNPDDFRRFEKLVVDETDELLHAIKIAKGSRFVGGIELVVKEGHDMRGGY